MSTNKKKIEFYTDLTFVFDILTNFGNILYRCLIRSITMTVTVVAESEERSSHIYGL